jgi:hypothetical protein
LFRLPCFNPHSFRNTLVQLSYELKPGAEKFKAWSQNLGHEHCLTTFSSYGKLPPHRQAELIRGLGKSPPKSSNAGALQALRKLADGFVRRSTAGQDSLSRRAEAPFHASAMPATVGRKDDCGWKVATTGRTGPCRYLFTAGSDSNDRRHFFLPATAAATQNGINQTAHPEPGGPTVVRRPNC